MRLNGNLELEKLFQHKIMDPAGKNSGRPPPAPPGGQHVVTGGDGGERPGFSE